MPDTLNRKDRAPVEGENATATAPVGGEATFSALRAYSGLFALAGQQVQSALRTFENAAHLGMDGVAQCARVQDKYVRTWQDIAGTSGEAVQQAMRLGKDNTAMLFGTWMKAGAQAVAETNDRKDPSA
jgi:hypothetical protein